MLTNSYQDIKSSKQLLAFIKKHPEQEAELIKYMFKEFFRLITDSENLIALIESYPEHTDQFIEILLTDQEKMQQIVTNNEKEKTLVIDSIPKECFKSRDALLKALDSDSNSHLVQHSLFSSRSNAKAESKPLSFKEYKAKVEALRKAYDKKVDAIKAPEDLAVREHDKPRQESPSKYSSNEAEDLAVDLQQFKIMKYYEKQRGKSPSKYPNDNDYFAFSSENEDSDEEEKECKTITLM
jgi:hypothetical protein